ncbi:MAG: hypothetical protein F6K40_39115 [Okeania sp. SIO3I5]|uniref:hypothetical protein n=1 Tax=Okeania sp. SIO3I5 TaxID=2607805 RepID=UPI0013BAF1DD|nr:hypothetical protein [Okeania sp. SIO3I5]NEQ41873.1 hypothetical protein [Okeania sp. SIO3I5]
MDEVVKKVSSLGLPGVILTIVMATSTGGIGGTYSLIAAIAILGGPFGMVGGLTVLGLMTIVGETIAEYGIEAILVKIYSERSKAESVKALLKEVRDLPISDDLKLKLNYVLESA